MMQRASGAKLNYEWHHPAGLTDVDEMMAPPFSRGLGGAWPAEQSKHTGRSAARAGEESDPE